MPDIVSFLAVMLLSALVTGYVLLRSSAKKEAPPAEHQPSTPPSPAQTSAAPLESPHSPSVPAQTLSAGDNPAPPHTGSFPDEQRIAFSRMLSEQVHAGDLGMARHYYTKLASLGDYDAAHISRAEAAAFLVRASIKKGDLAEAQAMFDSTSALIADDTVLEFRASAAHALISAYLHAGATEKAKRVYAVLETLGNGLIVLEWRAQAQEALNSHTA